MRFTEISSLDVLIFLVLVTDSYIGLPYINPERPTNIFAKMYIIPIKELHAQSQQQKRCTSM